MQASSVHDVLTNTNMKHSLVLSTSAGLTIALGTLLIPPRSMGQSQGNAGAAHLHSTGGAPLVPLQPLAQQVRRLEDALNYVGQPLPRETHNAINRAIASTNEPEAVSQLQEALDKLVLAVVDINAESRVKVERGVAEPALVEGGSRFFLIKVINRAGVTAPLVATSPNSGNVYLRSTGDPAPKMVLTGADVRDRWANISVYQNPPMAKRLSGFPLEYQLLEVFSRNAGQRSAEISFNVGQGTQDIGFRNDVMIVFRADAAQKIGLKIVDEKGAPTMASLTIRDRLNRLYPNPSKRLAPDFFSNRKSIGPMASRSTCPLATTPSPQPAVRNITPTRWSSPSIVAFPRNSASGSNAGSILRNSVGIQAITTFTRPDARIIKIPRRGCCLPT